MTPPLCTYCDSRTLSGYLLGTVPICRMCRDAALSFIESTGILMTDAHPLTRELCENSHYIPYACWEYYSYYSQQLVKIIRVVKKV